jgi:Tfp pilus assembly protein PilX
MKSLYSKARSHGVRQDESGIASIMVTMILMVVVSLVVLGFAQISRRNQRQVLDRQLSTQAFYAAESGVNDVQNLVQTDVANGTAVPAKISCSDTGGGAYAGLNAVLASNVSYTCVTVNPTPTTLAYNDIGTTSTIIPLITSSAAIGNLTLKWSSKAATVTPSANCPASAVSAFSPTASWKCGYGVLRIDLVPVSGAALSTAGLSSSVMTTFLVPHAGGAAATVAYAGNQSAATTRLRTVPCDNVSCTMKLTGLVGKQYFMRVSSLYQDVALSITGNNVPFQNALAVIDSTGKAQDVLRRVQVYVPLNGSSQNQSPDFALESTDSICKRFSVMPGFYQSNVPFNLSASNPLCQP